MDPMLQLEEEKKWFSQRSLKNRFVVKLAICIILPQLTVDRHTVEATPPQRNVQIQAIRISSWNLTFWVRVFSPLPASLSFFCNLVLFTRMLFCHENIRKQEHFLSVKTSDPRTHDTIRYNILSRICSRQQLDLFSQDSNNILSFETNLRIQEYVFMAGLSFLFLVSNVICYMLFLRVTFQWIPYALKINFLHWAYLFYPHKMANRICTILCKNSITELKTWLTPLELPMCLVYV